MGNVIVASFVDLSFPDVFVFIAMSGQSPNQDMLKLSQNVAADLAAELTSLL